MLQLAIRVELVARSWYKHICLYSTTSESIVTECYVTMAFLNPCHSIAVSNLSQGLCSVRKRFSQDCTKQNKNTQQVLKNKSVAHEVYVLTISVVAVQQTGSLQGVNGLHLGCPRVAPSAGVVTYTYHQWFFPFSKRRGYCQLPFSARRMQHFLQFASHSLPIVTGWFAGRHHLARSDRVCSHCDGVSVADEIHVVFECPALTLVRQKYAELFTPATDNMRSFFGQESHMQVFKFILDCLDFLDV